MCSCFSKSLLSKTVKKCCRRVLQRSLEGEPCREVSEKSVVEKSVVAKRWREVLDTSVVEECWTRLFCVKKERHKSDRFKLHSGSWVVQVVWQTFSDK